MRIAVCYEDSQALRHFGRTEQFKLCAVSGGKITKEQIDDTSGCGRHHGA